MHTILIILVILNIFAYTLMCIDKVKSIYKKWRISEKTLWILALCGGVFGIWIGMQYPLYHKAGKSKFKVFVPIIALVWIIIIGIIGYILYKF